MTIHTYIRQYSVPTVDYRGSAPPNNIIMIYSGYVSIIVYRVASVSLLEVRERSSIPYFIRPKTFDRSLAAQRAVHRTKFDAYRARQRAIWA